MDSALLLEIFGVGGTLAGLVYGIGNWTGKLTERLNSFERRISDLERVDNVTTDLLIRRATVEALNTGLIVPLEASSESK